MKQISTTAVNKLYMETDSGPSFKGLTYFSSTVKFGLLTAKRVDSSFTFRDFTNSRDYQTGSQFSASDTTMSVPMFHFTRYTPSDETTLRDNANLPFAFGCAV